MHGNERNMCVWVMQYKRLVAAEIAKSGSTVAAVQVCLATGARTTQMATRSWQIMSSIVMNNTFWHDT
jgi:hypothetical protein